MATDRKAPTPPEQTDWVKRQSLGGFLRDVTIAAVILGAGLWLYRGSVEKGKQLRALGQEAKVLMTKDSPDAYARAEEKLQAMLSLDEGHAFAISTLAELYAVRSMDHGLEADAPKAREWTKRAGGLDAPINERFGAVVLGLLGEGKFAEAEQYANEITQKAASSHAVNGLGLALRGQGKLEEAKHVLKKAADSEWRNPRFACDVAEVYFEDGDFANAQAFYGKGVESNSEHLRSLIGRARAQIARGRQIKDASETLQEVLARGEQQFTPKLKAEALTAMAELRLFERRHDEALGLADQAIAAFGGHPWGHFARGRALAALQRASEAAASFDEAIELDRFVPEFYYGGARAMLEAGDQTKAPALLDAYLQSLKEDDRLHLAYGDLLMKLSRPVQALEHYQKAVGFDSFNAQAHYAKAVALFDARSEVGAGLEETRAADLERLTRRMLNDLGVTLEEYRQQKWETKGLEKALAFWRSLEVRAFAWDSLGAGEKVEVLTQLSLDELRLALEVKEVFPEAHAKLGDIRFAKGEYAEGCQEYAQALVQMKQLQRPREQLAALREGINTRLVNEAKLRDVAKAWMDETAAFVR